MIRKLILASLLVAFAALSARELSAQTRQRVQFARGASSSTVKGTVRGFAYRDHVVGASAGQSVDVRLSSADSFTVFTIFLPNGDNLEGAAQTDRYTGELPVSGNYIVRVGMMRAEARRRGAVSNYSLTISIR